MKLTSISAGCSAGEWILRIYQDVRSKKRKSSARTKPLETRLILPASFHDGRLTPRRMRLMTVRSAPTSVLTSSSERPFQDIQSLSFMTPNVQHAHIGCQDDCACGDVAYSATGAHNAHMVKRKTKLRPATVPIPNFIAARRKLAGLTLQEAGDKIGRAHSTVLRYESGEASAPNHIRAKMAEAYRCSIADLFTDPNDPLNQGIELLRKLNPDDLAAAVKMLKGMTGT